jgi:Cu/Ag efflux pump CusA
MFETTVQLKPRSEWRIGMTPEKLLDELDRTVKVPGLTNIWVPPIQPDRYAREGHQEPDWRQGGGD